MSLEHWRCDACGAVDPAVGMSHLRAGHDSARCHGPVRKVEYVPAEQLRGAVEALRILNEAMGGDGSLGWPDDARMCVASAAAAFGGR